MSLDNLNSSSADGPEPYSGDGFSSVSVDTPRGAVSCEPRIAVFGLPCSASRVRAVGKHTLRSSDRTCGVRIVDAGSSPASTERRSKSDRRVKRDSSRRPEGCESLPVGPGQPCALVVRVSRGDDGSEIGKSAHPPGTLPGMWWLPQYGISVCATGTSPAGVCAFEHPTSVAPPYCFWLNAVLAATSAEEDRRLDHHAAPIPGRGARDSAMRQTLIDERDRLFDAHTITESSMTKNLQAVNDFQKGDLGPSLWPSGQQGEGGTPQGESLVRALQDVKAGKPGWFDDRPKSI